MLPALSPAASRDLAASVSFPRQNREQARVRNGAGILPLGEPVVRDPFLFDPRGVIFLVDSSVFMNFDKSCLSKIFWRLFFQGQLKEPCQWPWLWCCLQ